ncbi:MAG: ASKHA domain-containing protein [Desulfovibrionaceae bacterium]|nr:ASKHA domain-containing protein [Desulfovibrionaceae bacterium]
MKIYINRPWLGEEGGLVIETPAGGPLYQAVWLSGKVEPVPLCGGIGRCGRCRVRFLADCPEAGPEERQILGDEAVRQGWRLACRCQVPDRDELHLELAKPDARRGAGRTMAAADIVPCVMAVDIGTTSVAWRMLAEGDGRVLAEGEDLNPQAGAGADVISRIALALTPGGADRLASLIRAYLADRCAPFGTAVRGVVAAANTAMTEILAGTSVEGLAGAPYRLSLAGHETLDLPGLPPVYIPPLPAPFVGGDVTAGLLWLERSGTPKPYLLADLGTNGEIALVTGDGRLYLTSVPLGPSLEGIGLECGALAGPDVLTQFSLGPMGLAGQTSAGRAPSPGTFAAGISATGYLSLIEVLLRNGIMDEEGHLPDIATPPAMMPLARKLAARVDRSWQVPRFMVSDSLWVSLRDIEEILKVKAAFGVAVQSVLEEAGLAPKDLACLAIAGALGRYVRPQTLERLGFVPPGTAARVRTVGNTSLEGACLLAASERDRETLAEFCSRAKLLQPALDPSFHARYLAAMRFAG